MNRARNPYPRCRKKKSVLDMKGEGLTDPAPRRREEQHEKPIPFVDGRGNRMYQACGGHDTWQHDALPRTESRIYPGPLTDLLRTGSGTESAPGVEPIDPFAWFGEQHLPDQVANVPGARNLRSDSAAVGPPTRPSGRASASSGSAASPSGCGSRPGTKNRCGPYGWTRHSGPTSRSAW